MVISVKVVVRSKKTFLKESKDNITIYLNTAPVNGQANKALVKLLAEHFKVAKSNITIIKGLKSRYKTIKIEGI